MTLFICLSGDWKWVPLIYQRVREKPKLIFGVLLTSALVAVQLWIFMWGPLNGHGLDVSLGYFLLPLTMVITGRIVYGERMSHLQKIAAVFAAIGVANELYRTGGFSWTTLVMTYLPIWLAVVVLIIEGLKHLSRMRRAIKFADQ